MDKIANFNSVLATGTTGKIKKYKTLSESHTTDRLQREEREKLFIDIVEAS